MKTRAYILVLLVSLFLSACDTETVMDDSPATPTPFIVTGSIENDANIPLPSSARVYAVWVIPSDTPDYLYIYGSGIVDPLTDMFQLTLTEPPPAAALNSNEVGVAYLMLLDSDLPDGEISDSLLDARVVAMNRFYGATNGQAIVYINGNPEVADDDRPWVNTFNFQRGYNLAKNWIDPEGDGPDGFQPDSGSIVLQVQRDPSVFTYPNWY